MTKSMPWTALERQEERKVAHLAAIARVDTVYGGARALTIARKCSAWDATSVVSSVYGASTGKHSAYYEAWACPECGTVHLGIDSAEDCCAFAQEAAEEAEYLRREEDPGDVGISDDNWACGTLDPNT